jgi:DNA-binding LacI/PurR family transcriptional regulator
MEVPLVDWLKINFDRYPVVFMSNYPETHASEFHSVVANNIMIGKRAADYLLQLGIYNICFVNPEPGLVIVRDRMAGYRQVMENRQQISHVLQFDYNLWDNGQLLNVELPKFKGEGKVGFIGGTEYTIDRFYNYLDAKGLIDKERMIFVGCDGYPKLTDNDFRHASVQVDVSAMVRTSVQLMKDVIEEAVSTPTQLEVGCRLIEKDIGRKI